MWIALGGVVGRGQRGGAKREALKRQRQREARVVRMLSEESSDELFARLRSGAANVAGVTYQINLATLLLVSGRLSDSPLPRVSAVRPEGFEDIDCRLQDGNWLLVQSKQRSARTMSRAETASVIVHATQVEAARDYDGSVVGYAIVSNAGFAAGATGWGSTIPQGDAELTRAVRDQLSANGRDPDTAERLIGRTHLVVIEDPLVVEVESVLARAYSIPPAVAVIARSHLAADLALASSAQRGRDVATAQLRTLADVDSMISRLRETVDLQNFEAALREGVCEFADFSRIATDSEEQFFSGVRVVPSHVGADLDVVRVPECESILSSLESSRQVLIVGPSGTGKSGLLWRSASLLQDGPMLIRVLRVSSDSDVQSLIRLVRMLSPTPERRVVVCIDDLGRAATERWPEARDRLLEFSGVSILAACRQEDLLPSIGEGAHLVDSRLARESAARIYARLRAAGFELATEPEEAIHRADGLLMEFVAIATTGRRLREVLRTQLQGLDDTDAADSRELLAVITALHTLGRSVPADELPLLVGESPTITARRLSRLQDEHLIVSDDGTSWRALHDLRAEVLLDLLHEVPPPTLAATYARSIAAAPAEVRPMLYRRAATRVLRAARLETVSSVADRLTSARRVTEPLVKSIADRVRDLANAPGPTSAREIAALVDAAERLDVSAYAAATLGFVKQITPPTIDVSSYYLLAYTSRFSDIFTGNDLFRQIASAGARLPEWDSSARQTVVSEISDDVILQTLMVAPLDVAVRFSERLEGYRTLPLAAAAAVFAKHSAQVVDLLRVDVVDVFAQLIATLAVVAELEGPRVEQAFGPSRQRARWAVEADDSGFAVDVVFSDQSELPSSSSNLARASTYTSDTFCEVSAKAVARFGTVDVQRGYQPQAGQDPTSLNSQAVFLAQRLFDACPEADVVSVEVVVPARGASAPIDGKKRMRVGALPRRVATERSIALQIAVTELLSTERWTDRCRRQADASAQLMELLTALPARLSERDSSAGRRKWIEKVDSVAALVAQLPGPPLDPQLIGRLSAELPFAADFDLRLRETTRDPSKAALDLIAQCLLQVSQGLNDATNLGGAGLRLAGAPQALTGARAEDTLPEYAGVGPLLPNELDSLASMAARILVARGQGALSPGDIRGRSLEATSALTLTSAVSAADGSLAAVEQRLTESGVEVFASSVQEILYPTDPLLPLELIIAVDALAWAATEESLRSWGPSAREEAGFQTRTRFVAMHLGRLVQVGAVLDDAEGPLRAIDPTDYPDIARRLGALLAPSVFQDRADNLIGSLISASSANGWSRRRPDGWRGVQSTVQIPSAETNDDDPQAWADAVVIYRELESLVASEGDDGGTFAETLAGVDLSIADTFASPIVQAVGHLRALAIEADLRSLSTDDAS